MLRAAEDRNEGAAQPHNNLSSVLGTLSSDKRAEDSGQMELPSSRFAVADALLLSGAMLMLWWALR